MTKIDGMMLGAVGRESSRDGRGSWLELTGNPLLPQAAAALAHAEPIDATALLARLEASGLSVLDGLEGQFAIAWWQASSGRLRLIRDRFGMEPLNYWQRGAELVFGSRARDVAGNLTLKPALSMQGLVEYLTHCYLPGNNTLFEGVLRVPPGGMVEFSPSTASCQVQSWYRLSFLNTVPADEAAIAARYRDLLEASVARRLSDKRTGILLSGGMDSSSVATFARKHLHGDISSFSFRCAGAEGHRTDAQAIELRDPPGENRRSRERGEFKLY